MNHDISSITGWYTRILTFIKRSWDSKRKFSVNLFYHPVPLKHWKLKLKATNWCFKIDFAKSNKSNDVIVAEIPWHLKNNCSHLRQRYQKRGSKIWWFIASKVHDPETKKRTFHNQVINRWDKNKLILRKPS